MPLRNIKNRSDAFYALRRVTDKMRGMGHLLGQERIDDSTVGTDRLGIGQVLCDFADEAIELIDALENSSFRERVLLNDYLK